MKSERMAFDGPFTANMCVIIMPFGSTGCGFGAVPGTISQIICQKPGSLVSYTSLRRFESSQQSNGHQSGFCLRINGRVIEGLAFHSASGCDPPSSPRFIPVRENWSGP